MELRSIEVESAVKNLERRAERQESDLTLHNTYVDGGVLNELSDHESQIIFGRRGVGKSHLLRFHRHQIEGKAERIRYLIFDCDKLGSGTSTISEDPRIIARNYTYEFLKLLGSRLFDSIDALELEPEARNKAAQSIFAFIDKCEAVNGSFDYPNLRSTLDAFLRHTALDRLYLALDEFVSIPRSTQPHFAQALRLILAGNNKIVIKIAALTFQTNLSIQSDDGLIGLEIGADIFGDINLDDYFLIDENPQAVSRFFSQVLYNHLAEELKLSLTISPEEKMHSLVALFFTQEKCLEEIIRACEGNCRDLMNIFRLSYSEFKRSTGSKIAVDHVGEAARKWYREAKLNNISSSTKDHAFLNHIIQDVIKGKRSRCFMVAYQHAQHPLLLRLLNLRLFHRMKTVWSHPDRPGEPYHIYIIDYGCYSELKSSKSELLEPIYFTGFEPAPQRDAQSDIVPLPDRRSIRRIVVSEQTLNEYYVPHKTQTSSL